jgi:hypothetical protein
MDDYILESIVAPKKIVFHDGATGSSCFQRLSPTTGASIHPIAPFPAPANIKPSVRISRTGLSCPLRAKGYETYRAGSAFGSGS